MKNISFILLLFTFIISGCIQEPELAHKGSITSFGISDQQGLIGIRNIQFNITHPIDESSIGTITNSQTLFPYGSLTKPLVPTITAEGFQQILYQPNDKDTTLQFGTFTQIDFSNPVLFSVVSEDGENFTSYRVTIRSSQINPNKANWKKVHDSIPVVHYDHTKSFYLNNTLFVVSSYIDPVSNTTGLKLYSSANGENWTEESSTNFPSGIYHSICTLNNVCYIIGYVGWDSGSNQYSAKHEIWSSNDGVNWTYDNYPSGMTSIFKNTGVYDGKMYVWGGTGINSSASTETDLLYGPNGEVLNPDRTTWEFNGSEWIQKSNMPEDMPVRFSTATKYQDRLQVYGGEKANGEYSALFWSLISRSNWHNIPKSDIALYKGASLVNYDNDLWIIGGEGTDGLTTKTVQFSDNGGANFNDTTFSVISEVLPPFSFKSRKNQKAILTPNNELFILGGVSLKALDNNTTSNVEKVELFDMWRVILNKFKNE